MNAPVPPPNDATPILLPLFATSGPAPEPPPRPVYPPFTGLPDLPAIRVLRARRQFVPWSYRLTGGDTSPRTGEVRPFRWAKVPLDVRTGHGASVADPATWTDYETATAYATAEGCAGVGYVMTADDGLTGGDLDKVRDPESGVLDSWAAELVALAETYCEVSPSGRGIRIFGTGKPEKASTFAPAGAEIYGTGRWLSLTGHHLPETPVDIRAAPETFRRLEERVAVFRARARAEVEEQRQAEGGQETTPRRERLDGKKLSFWQSVDDTAMVNLDAWIPDLFLGLAKRMSSGGFRVSSDALARDLEEDLSIHPTGIRDWGVADIGDPKEGRRTPIALVKEWGYAFSHFDREDVPVKDAAFWLCERFGVEPESLGWNARKPIADYFDTASVEPASSDDKASKAAKSAEAKENKAKKRREHERRNPNDARRTITIKAGEIEPVVNQMEAALIARGGFYQRAGSIVSIGEMPIVTAGEPEATALRVIPKGKHAIAEAVSSAACMMRFDARLGDLVVIDPPLQLVETLMDRIGRLRLPPLAGVVTAPTMRPDGTVLDRAGYDSATGLFFDPGDQEFPAVPLRPSRIDAEAALAKLDAVIRHFPFVAPQDRSVALSAIVTACIRQAIPTAPLHAFTAPVRGSGKSMLADIASVIATGRPAAVMAQAGDEVESEKRLTGMLLQGAPIIALDNCTAPIDGAFLNAIVTQTVATVRPLGSSRMVDVPSNSFLMAGGNSLVVNGDMTRRTVLCSLDPRMERPETRQFDFNPVARAKAERGSLVMAVLTILLAHRNAGSTSCGDPLGSFEGWSRTVRDALVWLGCADPLLTMEAVQEDDPEKTELDSVLAKWSEKIGTERITVAQLIERVALHDYAQLRMDFIAIAGSGGTINARRLGKWISRNAKRRLNGVWLEHDGVLYGSAVWRLRRMTQS